MNALLSRRDTLATRRWWWLAAAIAVVMLVATLLSFRVTLIALEVSPILLVPGVGSALLARFGRSLWPAVALGDVVGQMVGAERSVLLVAIATVVHTAACLACATWLQHACPQLGSLAAVTRFGGISAAVSIVGATAMTPLLMALHDIPPGYAVTEVFGWMAMGYMVGFLVGGGLVLAWTATNPPWREAFRQPVAIAATAAVLGVAAVGLMAEIGPLVPIAMVGAVAVAGRAGARWGTAAIMGIALLVLAASVRGEEAAFGGANPAEHAANAMLAVSLFAAAILMVAGYRESGGSRPRSATAVAIIYALLMLVTGVTALAANEVALNYDTPFVLSGLLSLGAAAGLGVLRISRAPADPSNRRGITLAVVAGAVYVLNLALYLEAVPLVGSGPATGLTMTAPLAIVLLGMVVYRTRPTMGVVVAVALIVGGALTLASGAMGSPLGITLALSSAVVFGVSVIITKQALVHANVIDVTLASATAAAVVALAVGVVTEGVAAFDLSPAAFGALALAALGAQLVPTLGRAWALAQISPDVVGAEGVLAPVATTLLSFVFVDAITTGGEVLGLVLIATGAVVAALAGSRRAPGDATPATRPAGPLSARARAG